MAYATLADVLGRYSPIKTMVGTNTQDVSSQDVSSLYIADAESFINAFIGRRYVVPVSTEPLVTMLASDIAIFKILEDRAPRVPEFAQKRYDGAMDLLKMLRDGDMILTASGTMSNSGGDQEVWSNVDGVPPVFHSAEMIAQSLCLNSLSNDRFL